MSVTRTHVYDTYDRGRASRERAAANAVGRSDAGRAAGLRLPDAQAHFALTKGEGWSGEERRTERGVSGKASPEQERGEGGG